MTFMHEPFGYNPPKSEPVMARIFEGCGIMGAKAHIADGSIDVVINDPPFGIKGDVIGSEYRNQGKTRNVIAGYVEIPREQYQDFAFSTVAEVARVLRPGGSAYFILSFQTMHHFICAIEEHGLILRNNIVWQYPGIWQDHKYTVGHHNIIYVIKPPLAAVWFDPYARYGDSKKSYADRMDVWTDIPQKKHHNGEIRNMNSLPDGLVEKMLAYSSRPGDTVLDMFLGEFTTAKVALKMGRSVFGFEINPHAVKTFAPTLKGNVEVTRLNPAMSNRLTWRSSKSEAFCDV
ncbi:DNA-methyltransferase [Magnetovibrio blakemorei]|nr:site-specific DNA-methyltransferase [Magnetovibrio blakemorei]